MKYGLIIDEFVIYSVNGFGILVSFACFYYYYQYTDDKFKFERYLTGTLAGIVSVFLYVRFFYDSVSNIFEQLGFLASLCSVGMFGSPLLSISQVVKTGSALGHISLPVAASSLVVCVLWTVIGINLHDNFVTIPNGLGAGLALTQLLVYYKYRTKETISVLPSKLQQ
jgi:solute carrier family 50 protein (sugar transporter)